MSFNYYFDNIYIGVIFHLKKRKRSLTHAWKDLLVDKRAIRSLAIKKHSGLDKQRIHAKDAKKRKDKQGSRGSLLICIE